MTYVTLVKLREKKPVVVLLAAFALFAGGQVVHFLASQPLCRVSRGEDRTVKLTLQAADAKVNASFLMILAMDLAVALVFYMWMLITEEDWDDHMWYA